MPLTANERTALVEGIVANCECWGVEDVDVLNVFDDEKLEVLHKHALKDKGAPTGNASTPKRQTAEEWFLNAPPEIQSAVRNAMQIELNEKEGYVQRLTANVKEEAIKETVVNVLRTKSLDELKMLVSLLPASSGVVGNVFGLTRPSFSGASGAPVTNQGVGSYDKEDILPIPTLNFAEISDSNASRQKRNA